MTNLFVSNLVKEIFGQDASLIHFDEDSRLVISSRYSESVGGDNVEYMVHNFIYREEDGKGFLENGNYLHSFDQSILKYLQRKNVKPKIVVPISEEDGDYEQFTPKCSCGFEVKWNHNDFCPRCGGK